MNIRRRFVQQGGTGNYTGSPSGAGFEIVVECPTCRQDIIFPGELPPTHVSVECTYCHKPLNLPDTNELVWTQDSVELEGNFGQTSAVEQSGEVRPDLQVSVKGQSEGLVARIRKYIGLAAEWGFLIAIHGGLIILGIWLLLNGKAKFVPYAWLLPGGMLVYCICTNHDKIPVIKQIVEKRKREKEERDALEAERLAFLNIDTKAAREAISLARKKELISIGHQKWVEILSETKRQIGQTDTSVINRCTGSEFLAMLSWQELEEIVAQLLERQGWNTELTQSGADGGVDIRGRRQGSDYTYETLVAQVKHWTVTTVGAPPVRELLGAKVLEGASHALFVTSSKFVDGVRSQFSSALELWDGLNVAGQIDSMTDDEFNDFVTPHKEKLGKKSLADLQQLEKEKGRIGSEIQKEARNERVRTNQEKVLEYFRQINRSSPRCPKCRAETRLLLGKTYFWGCTRYYTDRCRGTVNVPEREPSPSN